MIYIYISTMISLVLLHDALLSRPQSLPLVFIWMSRIQVTMLLFNSFPKQFVVAERRRGKRVLQEKQSCSDHLHPTTTGIFRRVHACFPCLNRTLDGRSMKCTPVLRFSTLIGSDFVPTTNCAVLAASKS